MTDSPSEHSLPSDKIVAPRSRMAQISVCQRVTLLSIFLLFGLWALILLSKPSRAPAGEQKMYEPLSTQNLEASYFPSLSPYRVKASYGPFIVPDAATDDGMIDYNGLMTNPCAAGDCLITWMQAGLEYQDGRTANADTGLWLHHTVLYNTMRVSPVCERYRRKNHSPMIQAMFASGNERTPVDICLNGTSKTGYHLRHTDRLFLAIELMNMTPEPLDAVLTLTYEYIPLSQLDRDSQFSATTPLWLDIGGCKGGSDKPAKPNTTFSYDCPTWKSTVSGEIVFVGAHLHDGGTHLAIRRNDEIICDSVATYGGDPAYVSPPMVGMPGTEMEHISYQSACPNVGALSVGDTMNITAYYDTARRAPMVGNDGSLEPIMGISIVYVNTGEIDASRESVGLDGAESVAEEVLDEGAVRCRPCLDPNLGL